MYTCMYIYIYIYVCMSGGLALPGLPGLRRASSYHLIYFVLTQRVFPTSTLCFCSGGGQVILQRL